MTTGSAGELLGLAGLLAPQRAASQALCSAGEYNITARTIPRTSADRRDSAGGVIQPARTPPEKMNEAPEFAEFARQCAGLYRAGEP